MINIIGSPLSLKTYIEKDYYLLKGNFFEFRPYEKNDKVLKTDFIFNEDNLIETIDDFQSKIVMNSAIGEFGRPTVYDVSLSGASHLITNLFYERFNLYGEIKILKTNKGRVIEALLDFQVPLKPYIRATSVRDEMGISTIKKLFTFDLDK